VLREVSFVILHSVNIIRRSQFRGPMAQNGWRIVSRHRDLHL
jgi:hypothetical protein